MKPTIIHEHPTESIYWRELAKYDDGRRRWPTMNMAVWCGKCRQVIYSSEYLALAMAAVPCMQSWSWRQGGKPFEYHESRTLHRRLSPSEDAKRPYAPLPAKARSGRKKPNWRGRGHGYRKCQWLICKDCGLVFYE